MENNIFENVRPSFSHANKDRERFCLNSNKQFCTIFLVSISKTGLSHELFVFLSCQNLQVTLY